jgi:cytochrome b561
MSLKSTSERWGWLAQLFHWITALAVIGMATVGWYMVNLPSSPDKIRIYALHKSMGLTVLALTLLRLLWRSRDRRPLEPPMPPWQAWAARAVHVLLYALLLAIPLSGWLFNSASNFPLRWFDLFSVPSLTGGAAPDVKVFARAVHWYLFWVLLLAFIAHAGAALKHHFIDHDSVLWSMLPDRRKRGRSPPDPVETDRVRSDQQILAPNPAVVTNEALSTIPAAAAAPKEN